MPKKLQRATVAVIERSACSAIYGSINGAPISAVEVCAGGDKTDSCQVNGASHGKNSSLRSKEPRFAVRPLGSTAKFNTQYL